MSRYTTSGDPHQPPSTATRLPPLDFKHYSCCCCFTASSHSVPGDLKAYCRFHGGKPIDTTSTAVSRRRPPLSQPKIPAAAAGGGYGFVQKTATATVGTGAGTGVFIPVYCSTRIITTIHNNNNNLNNNIGGMEEGENQQKDYEEEIPIEMLLPSEWTY